MPSLNKPILILAALGTALSVASCAAPRETAIPAPTTIVQAPVSQPSATGVVSIPATTFTATAQSTPTPSVTPTITETPAPTISPTPLPLVGVHDCGDITRPGYYKLANDLKSPTGHDCFSVMSHNVVFDCDNHTIEGNTNGIKEHQYQYYAFFVRKFGFAMLETPTNVEIKNCRILHQRSGIFVGGSNNVYIHDNNFSDNYDDTDKNRFGIFLGPPPDGGGLRLDTVHGGLVENNTANNEAIGIDIRDSESIVVRNNTASGNSAWGISLLNTSHSQVSNNTVRDNIRYCLWGNGTLGRGCDAGGIILHDGASHNVVQDNLITGENGNGIFIKAHGSRCGDDNLLLNNKITDAVYNGVEMGFCDGNRVVGNEISGSLDAVYFDFSSNVEIRNNIIHNLTNHGVISVNSRNSIIADNQIVNAREGVYLSWVTYDPKVFFFLTPTPDNYASRDNIIENNLLRDNSVAGIHLSNSVQNRLTSNTFANNGKNLWVEGKNDGNVIAGIHMIDTEFSPLAMVLSRWRN